MCGLFRATIVIHMRGRFSDGERGLHGAPAAVTALLLLAGATANVFGPQPYMGLPLLAAAPLLAGAMSSLRTCMAIAALACLLSVALDLYVQRPLTALFVDLANVVVTSALAVTVNRILHWQRRHLAQARDVAEAAQRAVLPDPPRRVGPVEVAARYEAAETEARLGGDLYAVQQTPFGVRMLIGDVRGKGLQAVSSVSVAIGAFRQEAEHAPTLEELARRLDAALARESDRRGTMGDFEDFTTAVLGELTPGGDAVRLVNRGHPSPCLVHRGTVSRLEPAVHQLPLGMRLPGLSDGAPADIHPLPPGASLLLVTDGVMEARDARGTFYDPAEHLAPPAQVTPQHLVDSLVRDVTHWTGGGPQDDMAILALRHAAG